MSDIERKPLLGVEADRGTATIHDSVVSGVSLPTQHDADDANDDYTGKTTASVAIAADGKAPSSLQPTLMIPILIPEKSRYAVLAGLVLCAGGNALITITFASLVDPMKVYYDITSNDINNLNMYVTAVYVAIFWVSGIIMARIGLGWTLALAAFMNVLSVLFRLATVWFTPSLACLSVSQILCGCVQILILSAPPMVSNQWFPVEERSFATGIGVGGNIIGGAVGMLLPSNLVSEGTSKHFSTLYWIQLGVTVAGLLMCLFAKKRPTTIMPNALNAIDEDADPEQSAVFAAAIQRQSQANTNASANSHNSFHNRSARHFGVSERRLAEEAAAQKNGGGGNSDNKPFCDRFKEGAKALWALCFGLLKNKDFMLLLTVVAFSQGTISTLASLLMQIGQPFNISQATIGWLGFAGQMGGGVVGFTIGGLMAKFPNYKPLLIIFAVLTVIATLQFPLVAAIMGDGKMSTELATVLLGIQSVGICGFGIAQITIVFELGVEVTFPVSEELTSPCVFWTPSVTSMALVPALGLLLTNSPTQPLANNCQFILAGFLCISVIAAVFVNPTYKRREYEEEQKRIAEEQGGIQ